MGRGKRFLSIKKIWIIMFLLIAIIGILWYNYISRKENLENTIESNPPSKQIVVARYAEKLEWLKDDPFNKYPVVVYNKGGDDDFTKTKNVKQIVHLDNVGREPHAYIYHVINNYDNLADVTIFLAGSCNMQKKIDNAKKTVNEAEKTNNYYFQFTTDDLYKEMKDFQIDTYQSTNEENKKVNPEKELTKSEIRPFGRWYKHHFGDLVTKKYSWNGIFAVHKRHILQHPREYYENLIKELEVSSSPEVVHYFERAWGAVFGPLI
jgi:hypothetical protein